MHNVVHNAAVMHGQQQLDLKLSNAAVHDNGNSLIIILPCRCPPLSVIRVFFPPIFSSLLLKTPLTKSHAPNLDSSSTSLPVTFSLISLS